MSVTSFDRVLDNTGCHVNGFKVGRRDANYDEVRATLLSHVKRCLQNTMCFHSNHTELKSLLTKEKVSNENVKEPDHTDHDNGQMT